jgi:threonine synthase
MQTVVSAIKKYQEQNNYLLDPHSAIGMVAGELFVKDVINEKPKSAVIIVGTAHYGKFLPIVSKALGKPESEITQHPILKSLENLPTRSQVLENSVTVVGDVIRKTVAARSSKSRLENYEKALPDSKYLAASLVFAATAVAFFVLKRNLLAK